MADLVLYNYFRSSASFRARIALNLKGLKYEYHAVHLLNNGGENNREDYKNLNPSAQVPTLIHKGQPIGQSLAIMDYLDHLQPTPLLFPEAPLQRALVWQACEIVNSGTQPMTNLPVLKQLATQFHADDKQKAEWAQRMIAMGLEALEKFLKPHAGRYCFGDSVTAADCTLVPQLVSGERFNVDFTPYPTLTRVRAECEKLEAFVKAHPRAQPDTPADFKG